jgi:predicted regulator of Ras-like GTPase activity (Roadblock/LC7/MglB family)
MTERARSLVDTPADSVLHRRQQELLVGVHQHLRDELAQITDAVAQVVAGTGDAGQARASINAMSIRQNYWTLGAFCAAYCRVVTLHHTIESQAWFPVLAGQEPGLGEIVVRLHEEHEVIAGYLVALDEALVAVVAQTRPDAGALPRLEAAVARLSEALLAHLDGEESALLGPLGRILIEG